MPIIHIYDTTLRDGEQTPGVHFGPRQKLDIARRLSKTGVDIIEAGFPASSPGDMEAVKTVAEASGRGELGSTVVSALARMLKEDIDAAAEALADARVRRLHIFIATSDIHLRNKLRISRDECLARIRTCTAYGKSLGAFDEIEFSAEDATRSDFDFLCEAVQAAVGEGAGIVNVPDTVGYTTPAEFQEILIRLRGRVPGDWRLSVHCHNDLGTDHEFVRFMVHFEADTISTAHKGQEHILQNLFVYSLTDTLSTKDTRTNKDIPHSLVV